MRDRRIEEGDLESEKKNERPSKLEIDYFGNQGINAS